MLKQRVGTALVLFILFMAGLFYLSDFQWALLMLAPICMGAWEWATLVRLKPVAMRIFVGFTIALGAFLLSEYADPDLFGLGQKVSYGLTLLLTVFWVLIVPAWLVAKRHVTNPWLMSLVGLLVLVPTWLALDGLRRISPILLLAAMMTIWIADTAAYFSGKRFGKRKLAPAISPGKTWEGVIGALVAVAAYGVVLCAIFDLSLWLIPAMLILAILSVVGDLFESLLKRQAGLKDSGSLLPGHGGVLDRMDGLTSTLPLVLCYFPFYYALLTPA